MNLLIIYSNHQKGNFNWQLLERIKVKMAENGSPVIVRDLYELDFDPVLKPADFDMISRGTPPDDISKEQDFVRWADVLLFIYPVWWGGMPAIVKGYIDKVLSWGFAYKSNGNGVVYPLLSDKKAIVMSSLGQSKEEYEKGMFQAMSRVNSEGVFGFCGIQVLEQMFFSSIHAITPEVKEQYFINATSLLESQLITH
jgi:NAD(P)H dehydrogenase (quinone)